jgi:hypothetical protein
MRPQLKNLFAVSAIALAVAATGCTTTPTPFQPYVPEAAAGVHGGYSEQRLAPDRFVVRFHGNEFTSRDRVEGYLLYRSAQLTLESGYDTFAIADRHTEHDVETYVRPDPFYNPWYGPDYASWHPDWRYYVPGGGWYGWHSGSAPFWHDRPDIVRVEAFEATAEILLRKGPPSATESQEFDARKVIADLGPSIELPRP